MLHPLFSRQLARLGLDPRTPPSPAEWTRLLSRVSLAYTEADEARYLLERSIEVSSREMEELYERMRATSEYMLAFERDKLAAVLRSVAAGVLTLDQSGRISAVNPEAERLLGFSEGEAQGQSACSLLGVDKLDRSDRSASADAEFRCKNGERLPVSYALTPLFQGHVEVGGVLSFFDLTERRKVERLKNELVSTVSHELRTPLTSIRGALGLLAGGVLGELSSDARDAVAIAHENTERLIHLVNDILDMQKIEAGKMALDLALRNLLEIAKKSMVDNTAYAKPFGVTLVLEGGRTDAAGAGEATASALFVRADGNRIHQVLANLISNAVKFSPEGGVVRVKVFRDGDSARVEVHDQGPGIPEELRPRLFTKFAQADASSTRRRGGTGLGLSISKALVEQHGGAIGYENRAAGGTLFYFTLPCAAGEGAAKTPK